MRFTDDVPLNKFSEKQYSPHVMSKVRLNEVRDRRSRLIQ